MMQKEENEKKINITDVAEMAGVAVSTVSRVINNPNKVRPDTLDKVKNAIKSLNYKPNIVARSMRTGKTSTIAVVLPDISNMFFPELITGIEKVAQEKDYKLFICNSDESVEKETDLLKDLSKRSVDGIILSSVSGKENYDIINYFSNNIPLVVVDRLISNLEVGGVSVDDTKAIYKSTEYFLEKGIEEIAYIGGPLENQINRNRLRGFKMAFMDYEKDIDNDLIIEVDNFKAPGGKKAAQILMKLDQTPKAIVSANDTMAIGAIKKLISNGIKIPDDLEIIGFDDIPLSSLMIPSLSTVAQPIKEMGMEAVKMLFECMDNNKVTSKVVLLETKLILRETTQ